MDERGLLDLIIARLPELSYQEKIRLCESFGRESDLTLHSKNDIEQIIGRRLNAFWDIDLIRMLAERDAQMTRLRGIHWVSWSGAAYPPLLREIYDPPPLLFFRGNLPNPETPFAAIVGTRRPSPQAAAQAFDIAKDLGRWGIPVVSGLALGIDAMAHRGSIEGGVPTFAVLGSGADEVYPSANRALARRILETGGALLSEYPPGTGPRKWTFPARNRIVSGLSRLILVVEAPLRSGALITAGFALEQGRELCVASVGSGSPASPASPRFDRRGSARLVEEGAKVVFSAGDIARELKMENAQTGERDFAGQDSPADCGGGRALAVSLAHSLEIEL